MEVSEIVLWVEIGIKRKLFRSISISAVDSFFSDLSGPLELAQNMGWVELLVSWIKIIWLLVVSFLDILNILLK